MLFVHNLKRIQSFLFLATWTALMLTAISRAPEVRADEIPADLLALGPIEDEICGINFQQDGVKDVLRKLGKPISKKKTEMGYDDYIWKKESLTIEIES